MLSRVLIICLIATGFQLPLSAQVRDSVALRVTDGTLYGVLTSPKKAVKPPIALIISDAGGCDRDGNMGMFANSVLKHLSDSLAKRGIASLRYDKRGVGRSSAVTDESRLRFSDYVMDAVAWAKWIRSQNRWSRIVLVGHGEGALVGALAANDAGVDAFVSLLGPAESADTMIMRQLVSQGLVPGAVDTVGALFAELRARGRNAVVPPGPFYVTIFRPTVQPYLYSWIQYQPIEAYRNLKAPALFIAGSTDLQQDSMQIARISKGVPKAAHLLIPGMNRMLRNAPKDPRQNMDTYYDPGIPLSKKLVPAVAAFIRGKG